MVNMIEVINKTNDKEYINIIKHTIKTGLKIMNITNAFLSVVIVSNSEIHKINKIYRKIDKETDVISFAFEETEGITPAGIRILGEIYISVDKAKEQARIYGHSLEREVSYLSVHGLLHLLGYDHIKETDKQKMRALEEKILNAK